MRSLVFLVGCTLVVAGLVWWARNGQAPAPAAAAPVGGAAGESGGSASAPRLAAPEAERRAIEAETTTPADEPATSAPADPTSPCSVAGTVRFEPGIAASTVTVALFVLRDGRPERQPVDRATVAVGERFCLRSAVDGRHALAALARGGPERTAELLRPATAIVELAPGAEVELAPLELGWGESLAGHVVDPDPTTIDGIRLSVRLLEREPSVHLAGLAQLSWRAGRFELALLERNSTDGTFHVRGLAPLRYALRANGTRPAHDGVPSLSTAAPREPVEATASAAGLVVSTGRVLPVRFCVTSAGHPLQADVTVLEEDGESSTQTNAEGLVDLSLDLARRNELRFSQIGHLTRELQFAPNALAPGSIVDVALERAQSPATLVIELAERTAEQLAGHPIDLSIHTAESIRENPASIFGWPMDSSSGRDAVDLVGRPFRPELVRASNLLTVEALPPGHYLVRVLPRLARDSALPDSMWLEERFELELAPGERAERFVQLELGGRVRLDVRGQPSSGRFELELEGHSEYGVRLYFAWPGKTPGSITSSTRPLMPGLSHLIQPLAAGSWAVHVRSREATLRTVAFTVAAGSTRDVVVDLAGL